MYVVAYTRLNAENRTEIVQHQEYNTKQEADDGAEALALSFVNDETVDQVLRGAKLYEDVVDYNVVHEIPR